MVAPGGTIVVLGVHFGPVELDWMPLFHREARLIPSLGYGAHEGGREMQDAAEAFRVASDKTEGAIRVVIEPS